MAKKLFITGTGTDVGKTYVTGLLLKKLTDENIHAAYFKAAMSGNERDSLGNLIPGDALQVKTMAGLSQELKTMCPYVYENAVSPHLASKLEGKPVRMEVVKASFEKLSQSYDYVVMEGSGGIICPIRYDNEIIHLEDIIATLGLSSLIIANAGLGTINQVVLTVEYMKQRNLPVKGIIFNNYHGNAMEEDNIFMCEELTNIPVVARVAPSDTDLHITKSTLLDLFS